MSLAVGSLFGRFRILACAGRGGMGEVYRAEDTTLGRIVALKTIRADVLAGAGPSTAARDQGRFQREARILAAFNHPNAVSILGYEEIGQTAVLVMEWVDGRSLRDVILEDSATFEQRVRWLREAASALAALHDAGIVHRDLKPTNLMVDATERLRLLDFGIARFLDPERAARLTATQEVIGTPRYMAPEQLAGLVVDTRADQFAWGLVAYELLTGKHPRPSIADRTRTGWKPLPMAAVGGVRIPASLEQAILRALSPAPIERFPSMRSLTDALDVPSTIAETRRSDLSHPPARSRRPWIVFGASAAAAMAVGAIALGALLVHRTADAPQPPVVASVASPDAEDASSEPSDADVDVAEVFDAENRVDASAPKASPTRASGSRALPHLRFGIMPHGIDPAAARAWLARRESAVWPCYQLVPPADRCIEHDLSCRFSATGAVDDCAPSVMTKGGLGGSCTLSAKRSECIATALTSADGPPIPEGTERLSFRIFPVGMGGGL